MVPVVQVGSKYDFEQSLVITVVASEEDPSVRCIFPENVPAGAEMTLIPAGGSISGTVNTSSSRASSGPWGSRVYFNFGLGGLVAQNFFYYYSSIHDAMRAK